MLTLRDKDGLVRSLRNAVNHAETNFANVPGLVRRIIETGAWEKRTADDGKVYEHKAFLDFITAAPLAGCGWKPDKVEALIKDDAETLTLWRGATTAEPHRPAKESHNNVITSKQGNNRAYTLDRLKRERPDLFDQVKAGKLSANAAAIKAGWRKKPTRLHILLQTWEKATRAERNAFLAEIMPTRKKAA